VLGSVLARDGYLPRQLHTRGDRLAFSNGIIVLAGVAILLIVVYRANVTNLIQLYIVGVFVSFTLSQLGMIRHWNRLLPNEPLASERRRMIRSRATNAVGFVMTGTVLFIVLITKFTKGAWIVCIAMPLLYWLMQKVHQHYQRVKVELAPEDDETVTLPARTHAVVLVSKIHKPTMRALAYARASRPDRLEAVTVNVDSDSTANLMADWDAREVPVPLKVLDSPYRAPHALVGGPRADAALLAISGRTATTMTIVKGPPPRTHTVPYEVPPKLLTEWLDAWRASHAVVGALRAVLRPHSAGSELLELCECPFGRTTGGKGSR
jgi:hypothetical protein